MGAGLEWVEYPESPGIGRKSWSSSPTLSRCRSRPSPPPHTPTWAGEALGGSPPLRWRGEMRRG